MQVAVVFVRLFPIQNFSNFSRSMMLPLSILELHVEVYHEERVLEVDEDKAPIHTLFAVIMIVSNVLDLAESIFVINVDFFFEFILRIATRHVFDTKVSPEILTSFDFFNVNGVFILGANACSAATRI